ncbi:MAG: c-type cytochrome [Nitrospinota bacterium]|nr:c-type cytochrome [Nitrospinota bacterium]
MTSESGRRRMAGALALLLGAILALGSVPALAVPAGYGNSELRERKPKATPELVAKGKVVYEKRCGFCHGEKGDGNGPVADYLHPRPRDFTKGLYKFRTTKTGESPTDEDIFRTVSLGAPGTGMPAWGEGTFRLPEDELWQVVFYIKSFFEDFADPEFNPYEELIKQGPPPAESSELIQLGRKIYIDEARGACVKCHGPEGRGDGEEAGTQKDDWDAPIMPANLAAGWRYKNWGPSLEEVFRTLSTGLNGTPMPGYSDSLNERERWALAYYVSSLQAEEALGGKVVLTARSAEGKIPLRPDDPRWDEADRLEVPLSGQLIVRPRWPNPSVDRATVRALHDGRSIAFRISWFDRFKNESHKVPKRFLAPQRDSFVSVKDQLALRTARDAIALQFPAKPPAGPRKPYFFLGGARSAVDLWEWRADWQKNPADHGGRTVLEQVGKGFSRPPANKPAREHHVRSQASFSAGQWQVVIVRPLQTPNLKTDVQFAPGMRVPFVLHAWDGRNGEFGMRRSVSSWHYVQLDAETPIGVYLYALLGGLVGLAFEGFLVRRVRGRRNGHSGSGAGRGEEG